MKLTVVFEDHRVQTKYANGHVVDVDFYSDHGELFLGNTVTKTAFTDTVTAAGHNMTDYWAIQYHGGSHEIEYANGHPNQVVSGNTGLSDYISLVNHWRPIIDQEVADAEARERAISGIEDWETARITRDRKLLQSDAIISWSTETGNAVPSEWTTYRQALRDITTTYGAPDGDSTLIVWPTQPAWPSA